MMVSKHRILTIWIISLLCLSIIPFMPGVSADWESLDEDFEDDVIGNDPSESWYSYSEQDVVNTPVANVQNSPVPSKALKIVSDNNDEIKSVFQVAYDNYSYLDLWFYLEDTAGCNDRGKIRVGNDSYDGNHDLIYIAWKEDTAEYLYNGVDTGMNPAFTTWYHVNISFNYTTHETNLVTNGVDYGWQSFVDGNYNGFEYFWFEDSSSVNGVTGYFDNLTLCNYTVGGPANNAPTQSGENPANGTASVEFLDNTIFYEDWEDENLAPYSGSAVDWGDTKDISDPNPLKEWLKERQMENVSLYIRDGYVITPAIDCTGFSNVSLSGFRDEYDNFEWPFEFTDFGSDKDGFGDWNKVGTDWYTQLSNDWIEIARNGGITKEFDLETEFGIDIDDYSDCYLEIRRKGSGDSGDPLKIYTQQQWLTGYWPGWTQIDSYHFSSWDTEIIDITEWVITDGGLDDDGHFKVKVQQDSTSLLEESDIDYIRIYLINEESGTLTEKISWYNGSAWNEIDPCPGPGFFWGAFDIEIPDSELASDNKIKFEHLGPDADALMYDNIYLRRIGKWIRWNVTIEDVDGHSMDYTIECNNSQSTSGNGVSNGSYYIDLSVQEGHNYTVWVNVTDGFSWTNESYWFIVRDNTAPTSSNPIPADASTGNSIVGFDWSIDLEDAEGDEFEYNIEWGNLTWFGKTNNATITIQIPETDYYEKTYTVYVNLTDEYDLSNSDTYTFTIQCPVITLSASDISLHGATMNGKLNFTLPNFMSSVWENVSCGIVYTDGSSTWNWTALENGVWVGGNETGAEIKGGDLNGDGWVNNLDSIILAEYYLQTGDPGWVRADINKDGIVNYLDVSALGNDWDGDLSYYDINYPVSGLNSTWKYTYQAWMKYNPFHDGEEEDFWTLPEPPSNPDIEWQNGYDLNITWTNATTNDWDNASTLVLYGTSCVNETTGTLLTETDNEYWEGTLPLSPSGFWYISLVTNFSGNYSDPACFIVGAGGGNYSVELRHEDSDLDWGYVDLNESGEGRLEWIVYYEDNSEEHNWFVVEDRLPALTWDEWYNYTFIPELEDELQSVVDPLGGCTYIKKVDWQRIPSNPPVSGYYDAEIDVTVHSETADIWAIGIYEKESGTLWSINGGVSFAAGEEKTVSFTSEFLSRYWSAPEWDPLGIGDAMCIDDGFIVRVIGEDEWQSINNPASSGSSGTLSAGCEGTSLWAPIISPIWNLYYGGASDLGTYDWCVNFTLWYDDLKDSVEENISDYGGWVPFPDWPTFAGIDCGGITSDWTDCETNMTDVDVTDGKWYFWSEKDVLYTEFIWSEGNNWVGEVDYCDRITIPIGHDINFYIRTDLPLYPYLPEFVINESGLFQYQITFSNIDLREDPYANIYIIDSSGVKRIIHSEYLDANRRINPQLIFGQTYWIEVVDSEGAHPIGQFTAGRDLNLLFDVSVSFDEILWRFADIFADWSTNGFTVSYEDYSDLTEQITIFIYAENGTLLDEQTHEGKDFSYEYVGAKNVSYYWQIEATITGFGDLSTPKIKIWPGIEIPSSITDTDVNVLFTILFGPTPFTMGGVTITYAHIIVFLLALVGLFAFKKNPALGLFVEGICMIGGAALLGIENTGSGIIIGAIGFFLIILGLLSAIMSTRKGEKEVREQGREVYKEIYKEGKDFYGGRRR